VPLMRRYYAFATQIGCVVVEDNVQATARQSKLLEKWWKENASAVSN
jgi:hypothetical protein